MPHAAPDSPSEWLTRFAHLLPAGGSVLDLACGSGRNSRYLQKLGLRVLALDRDAQALRSLEGVGGIQTLQLDVESAPWPFSPRAFDGVVVINYLHRPLFEPIFASLRPGGVLIYETFAAGNERFGRPSNPDFLLGRGELLERLPADLAVVAFEQGILYRPKPAAVQRICAVRGAEQCPLEAPDAQAETGLR